MRKSEPKATGRTRVLRVLRLVVVLTVLSVFTAPGHAAASAARFTAVSARWDDDVLTVTFLEVGLEPGATTTISTTARNVADGVCEKDGGVRISVRVSASAQDVSDYRAVNDGSVAGERVFTLSVHAPVAPGLDCTMDVTRSFSLALRDLTTGATKEIHGEHMSNQLPVARAGRQASQGAEHP